MSVTMNVWYSKSLQIYGQFSIYNVLFTERAISLSRPLSFPTLRLKHGLPRQLMFKSIQMKDEYPSNGSRLIILQNEYSKSRSTLQNTQKLPYSPTHWPALCNKTKANCNKLTEIDDELIVLYAVDLDTRGFVPWLTGVEDIVNYILELYQRESVKNVKYTRGVKHGIQNTSIVPAASFITICYIAALDTHFNLSIKRIVCFVALATLQLPTSEPRIQTLSYCSLLLLFPSLYRCINLDWPQLVAIYYYLSP